MKNSSAYKPNQQINGKEGKGKKRNDSGVAFEQEQTGLVGNPASPACGYLYIKTKHATLRPVFFVPE